MSTDRPAVPEDVKRLLRQEACFGCCKCGRPLFQFQHIIPYSVVPHFRPSDMMALCPNHHDDATRGLMDEAKQRVHKANPYNCAHGFAKGQLTVRQRDTRVDLGGHQFYVNAGDLVRVDGEPLIRLALSAEDALLLSVRLYAEDDSLVAEVLENEWVSQDRLPWDIEFDGKRLRIRSAPRKISLQIDCRTDPVLIRGELWRKGRRLIIDNQGIHADQADFVGAGMVQGAVVEMDAAAAGTTGFRLAPQGSEMTIRPQTTKPPPFRRERKVGRNEPCFCGSGKKYKRCHDT